MSEEKFDYILHIELVRRRRHVDALIRTAPSVDCVMLNRIKQLEVLRSIAVNDQAEEWRQMTRDKHHLQFTEYKPLTPPVPDDRPLADACVTHRSVELPPEGEWRRLVLLYEAERYLSILWEKQSGVKT